MGLKEADVRMWDYYQNDLYANLDEQLEDGVEGPLNTLNDKQPILLEEKVIMATSQPLLCVLGHGM